MQDIIQVFLRDVMVKFNVDNNEAIEMLLVAMRRVNVTDDMIKKVKSYRIKEKTQWVNHIK